MKWNNKNTYLLSLLFVLVAGQAFADGFLNSEAISEDLAIQKQKLTQLILSHNANQLVCDYVPVIGLSREPIIWITFSVDQMAPSNILTNLWSEEKSLKANVRQLSVGDSIVALYGDNDRRTALIINSKTMEGVEHSSNWPVFLHCRFHKH